MRVEGTRSDAPHLRAVARDDPPRSARADRRGRPRRVQHAQARRARSAARRWRSTGTTRARTRCSTRSSTSSCRASPSPQRDTADWVGALREVAHAYRRIAHDHPNAFPLLATRRFATEGTYAFLEQLFELARRQGIDDRTTARFYRVVSSYCSGFALNELAARARIRDDREGARAFTRSPRCRRGSSRKHLDDLFEFGLDVLLGSLALTATGGRGAHRSSGGARRAARGARDSSGSPDGSRRTSRARRRSSNPKRCGTRRP